MSKGVPSTRERGAAGEESAVRFLQQNGYEIIEKNYYYLRGEIDIVAKDGAVLVFVEVKSRRSTSFGAPEESVTPKKQEKLRRTAEGYVAERGIEDTECRFDVVSVMIQDGIEECTLLKNCF